MGGGELVGMVGLWGGGKWTVLGWMNGVDEIREGEMVMGGEWIRWGVI